jgi:hypothetical protein
MGNPIQRRVKLFSAVLIVGALVARPGLAQELEPRAYRTLPIGLNAFVLAGIYSKGNVVADATSPIQELELTSTTAVLAYLRSFGLFGRSASLTVQVPYLHMSGSGFLNGEFLAGSRSGASNLRLRLAANVLGGPALTPAEFAKYRQRRNLGVGLSVRTPTGQYDSSRLISFGSNRWSFKPEIGYSSIKGRWILELAAGVWLFTSNDDFFGGATQDQDPIGSFQGHISYNFKNRMWVALNANYYTGGRTTVNGTEKLDLQRNSRVGCTFSVPLARRHSLKMAAHTGAFTQVGADFDVVTLAYQFLWGGR